MNEDNELKCTYCGSDYGLQREHVIPVLYLGTRKWDPTEQWIVIACKECNLLAGSKLCFSIPEKARYILSRYKLRYKKVLRMPYWGEDELKEVGRNIRESIKAMMIAKIILERKFEYLKNTIELPLDYLRPKFVENKILEWKERCKKTRKKIKKRK